MHRRAYTGKVARMDVLKPPTDNLYKFISIFGLIIFVVSIAAPYIASEQLSTLTTVIAKPIADIKLLNQDNARLLSEVDEVQGRLPKQSQNLTEAEKQTVRQVFAESDRLLKEVRENIRKIRELETTSDMQIKTADARAATLLGLIWWTSFGKVIGLVSILTGFTLWYFKLQRYQDLLLKNQAQLLTKEPSTPKTDNPPIEMD